MSIVIGVKFRFAGRLYYFGPNGIDFSRGDKVIVETARGRELGTVTMENREVPDEEIVQPLKDIIRKATDEDILSASDNQLKEADAFARCKEKIAERGLDMKLIQAEYTFDGSKVIFYFTSDKRVDFRELVKDLASMFKTRIELRQIGVRDETMIMGGIGVCGRPLCCKSYLNDFVPVSIKMAKEQNLSLNPTKISGVCGRLMCCLNNEEETYEYLNSQLPRMGETVRDKFGGESGTVVELNVLRQKVKVRFEKDDESEIKEFPVSEIEFSGKKLSEAIEEEENNQEEPEELAILEELDEQDEEHAEAEEPAARKRSGRHQRRNRHGNRYHGNNEKGQESHDTQEYQGSPENRNTKEHRDSSEEAKSHEHKNSQGHHHHHGRNRHGNNQNQQ